MGQGDAGQLVSVVAVNIREKKGWSLSELASNAGIGKSTLSMLEAGKGNPSIETLWAICAALGIPFGQLIQARVPEVRVVRAGEGVKVASESEEVLVRLLNSGSRRGTYELYVMETEEGSVLHGEPHIKGTVENVLVITGRMRAGPMGALVNLSAGDLAVFPADVPHVYETLEPGSRTVMVMDYE